MEVISEGISEGIMYCICSDLEYISSSFAYQTYQKK